MEVEMNTRVIHEHGKFYPEFKKDGAGFSWERWPAIFLPGDVMCFPTQELAEQFLITLGIIKSK
jgi:hypothetical protein